MAMGVSTASIETLASSAYSVGSAVLSLFSGDSKYSDEDIRQQGILKAIFLKHFPSKDFPQMKLPDELRDNNGKPFNMPAIGSQGLPALGKNKLARYVNGIVHLVNEYQVQRMKGIFKGALVGKNSVKQYDITNQFCSLMKIITAGFSRAELKKPEILREIRGWLNFFGEVENTKDLFPPGHQEETMRGLLADIKTHFKAMEEVVRVIQKQLHAVDLFERLEDLLEEMADSVIDFLVRYISAEEIPGSVVAANIENTQIRMRKFNRNALAGALVSNALAKQEPQQDDEESDDDQVEYSATALSVPVADSKDSKQESIWSFFNVFSSSSKLATGTVVPLTPVVSANAMLPVAGAVAPASLTPGMLPSSLLKTNPETFRHKSVYQEFQPLVITAKSTEAERIRHKRILSDLEKYTELYDLQKLLREMKRVAGDARNLSGMIGDLGVYYFLGTHVEKQVMVVRNTARRVLANYHRLMTRADDWGSEMYRKDASAAYKISWTHNIKSLQLKRDAFVVCYDGIVSVCGEISAAHNLYRANPDKQFKKIKKQIESYVAGVNLIVDQANLLKLEKGGFQAIQIEEEVDEKKSSVSDVKANTILGGGLKTGSGGTVVTLTAAAAPTPTLALAPLLVPPSVPTAFFTRVPDIKKKEVESPQAVVYLEKRYSELSQQIVDLRKMVGRYKAIHTLCPCDRATKLEAKISVFNNNVVELDRLFKEAKSLDGLYKLENTCTGVKQMVEQTLSASFIEAADDKADDKIEIINVSFVRPPVFDEKDLPKSRVGIINYLQELLHQHPRKDLHNLFQAREMYKALQKANKQNMTLNEMVFLEIYKQVCDPVIGYVKKIHEAEKPSLAEKLFKKFIDNIISLFDKDNAIELSIDHAHYLVSALGDEAQVKQWREKREAMKQKAAVDAKAVATAVAATAATSANIGAVNPTAATPTGSAAPAVTPPPAAFTKL